MKYEFEEGVDFLTHKNVVQTPSGSKHVIDYIFKVDVAKEIGDKLGVTAGKIRQFIKSAGIKKALIIENLVN